VSIAFGGPPNDPTFLVTYSLTLDGVTAIKYARFVRYVPGGAPTVSGPIFIADVGQEWNFSEKAQNFWNGQHWVIGTRVKPPGAQFSGPRVDILQMNATITATRYYGDDQDLYGSPALTCAANGICVLVGFKAGVNTGFSGGTYGQRFSGADLTPFGGIFSLAAGNANEDQGVVYRSHLGDFLVQWFRDLGSFGYIDTRTIATDGSLGPLDLLRGIGPEAGANAIAYNPTTQTSLLVTKWTGASLVVMELGDDGYPIDMNNIVLVTQWDGSTIDYFPSIAVNPEDFQWLVSAQLSAGPTGRVIQGVTAADWVQNGTFSSGMASWGTFALPTPQDFVVNVINGVLTFYRQTLPPGVTGQGLIQQSFGIGLPAGTTLTAVFDIGNSSSVRKRISVLIQDSNFSDLFVCTFWLAPGAPLRTYRMNTHTNQAWANATISFYAASTGSNNGAYLLDNVHAYETTGQNMDRTQCVDPTTPLPSGQPDGANLLTNGDFSTGHAPWGTFGQIIFQTINSMFEFYRPGPPPSTPAGVVQQQTGVPLPLQSRLTATFSLGNSSGVRKRVTVLLQDADFGDLAACTFWLLPGQPLAQHTMRSFTTRAWASATVSVYVATIGSDPWIQLDDVSLRVTPGAVLSGTDCLEPAGSVIQGALAGAAQSGRRSSSAQATKREVTSVRVDPQSGEAGQAFLIASPIDLRDAIAPVLSFESRLAAGEGDVSVEVTRDGRHWIRIARVPQMEDWTSVSLDLSPFAGDVVYVRFVSSTSDWLVRAMTVQNREGARMTLLYFER
jgi:hypothetical protein